MPRCARAWPRSTRQPRRAMANRLHRGASTGTTGQPDAATLAAAADAPATNSKTGMEGIAAEQRPMERMHGPPMATCMSPETRSRPARPRRRRLGAGASGPRSRSGGQGVLGLRQGRDRQVDHLVEPVGGILDAGQARAADRLRSQARQHLHADQAADADGDRHPRRTWISTPRSCGPRTMSSTASTA